MRLAHAVLGLMLLPPVCNAGGTVAFGQVDRLLRQKPEIRAVLLASLVMPGSAEAQIRLGPHFKHLGGHRLGQYTFDALPREQGGVPVRITLCTSWLFLDSAGRVLPEGSDQEFAATQVRELLNAVVLRDAGVSSAAECP